MDEPKTEIQAEVDEKYRVTATIVSVQFISSLMIFAVGWFVVDPAKASAEPSDLTAVWVLIIFIAGGSLLLRRLLNSWERLRSAKLLKGYPGVLATLQTNSILLAAMADAIVIIGFVVAFMSGEKFDLVRAALVGFIVFAVNFPRRSRWYRITEALKDV